MTEESFVSRDGAPNSLEETAPFTVPGGAPLLFSAGPTTEDNRF
jgi:hypothetical protein